MAVRFQGALSSLIVAVFCAGAALASEEEVVVTTGKDRGAYFYVGARLTTAMFVAHKRPVKVLTSRGSIENLERLDDPNHPAAVGLTQADALKSYLGQHPEFAEEFIVLGNLGKECAFLVTGAGTDIEKAPDLQRATGAEISVDDAGSGAAVTYRTMSELEPAFRRTTPVFVDTLEALLQLKLASEFTKLRAALFVQRPRGLTPQVQVLIDNRDAYRLVPIREGDLPSSRLPDGSQVYTFETVSLGGKGRRSPMEVETLCTRGLMLAAKAKLSKDMRSQLSHVMLESAEKIVGKDE